jgi:acyl-CoA oxidase
MARSTCNSPHLACFQVEVADIHASSSALKSFTTTIAADGIEECRKACGGHGFLACSGLPELINSYLQSPTVEGDNHMLPQQVFKVLLKLVQAVQSTEIVDDYKSCDSYGLVPSLQAIVNGKSEQCGAIDQTSFCDLDTLLLAFRHRAARLLVGVARQLEHDVAGGTSMQQAWNDALVAMAKGSRAYSLFLVLQDFVEGIREEQRSSLLGPNEIDVLFDLARLFGLYWVEKDLGEFLEDGYFTSSQAKWVAPSVLLALGKLRPNAVALVDARDISDFRLKSVLGRFDGDVYPHIMEAAERDPLNSVDPGPGYDPALKALIRGGAGVFTVSRL